MISRRWFAVLAFWVAVLVLGCSSSPSTPQTPEGTNQKGEPSSPKTPRNVKPQ